MKIERIRSVLHSGMNVLELTIGDYVLTIELETSEYHLVPIGNPQDLVGLQFRGLSINGIRESNMIDPQRIMSGMFSDVQAIVLSTDRGICVWQVVNQYGSYHTKIYVGAKRKIERKEVSMNNLKIRIKYFDDEIKRVEKIGIGDWIDLRCAKDVTLKAGEHMYIPLGVAMELPKGYEAWLTTRSSTAKKFGIYHCDDVGVIDGSYCGDNDEWKLPAIALRDTTIHKNDRIAQFRIHKVMPTVEFEEVESLGNPDRGGLGSTGKQ